ncbi:serine hydrolase domain-containing protein [Actinotalea ferrariae]|uniref:serine hydrolase domain-containing protein n=1 Tax=Actinotalea ferrariae TaxID=1386098 RepID=UPI000AEAF8A6|nr:serine hydrolase domain-containing protein [Actinotalea ferrariae]
MATAALLSLVLAPVAAGAAGRPAVPSSATGVRTHALALTLPELDAFVERRADAAGLPGLAYGVVQDGAVVHTAAFGVAGADGRPMTTTTVMNTASVGKTYTALAIAQLVAAGDLDLDARGQQHVPGFDLLDREAAAAVTVRHLLEHTSGLSTADGNRPWLLDTGARRQDLLERIADLQPAHPPGTVTEDCNLNYVLLGAVVEAVSGRDYFTYLQDEVLGPLGMTSTFRTAADARAAGRDVADGYRYVLGLTRPADVPMPLAAEAAGMQWTTIEDLATYAAVLADHGTVAGRSVVSGVPGSEDVDYDVDWQPATWAPDDGFGHSGGWVTYTAGLEVLPHHGFAVVMLANANPAQAFPAESTFDVALDTMRVANGWPEQGGSRGVGWYYAWADVVIALLAFGLVLRWLRLPARTARWARTGPRGRRLLVAAWTTLDGLAPLAAVTVLPLVATGMDDPGEAWARLWTSVPDLAGVLLVLAVGSLALGVAGTIRLRTGRAET